MSSLLNFKDIATWFYNLVVKDFVKNERQTFVGKTFTGYDYKNI